MTHADHGTIAAGRGRAGHRQRRCLVTGDVRDPAELVRYVVGPDDAVVPDIAGTLPGRGLWVGARRELVDQACKRGRFARAAGGDRRVRIDGNLADRTERLLRRRCLDFIGLARRAGLTALGEDKVARCLRAGKAAVVIIAADSGAAGPAKLNRLAAGAAAVPVVTAFDGADLGQAVGRDHAGYVALRPGALADRFRAEMRRLDGFRRSANDAVSPAGDAEGTN